MLVIAMTYPDRTEEVDLAQRFLGQQTPEMVVQNNLVHQVIKREDLATIKNAILSVNVKNELVEYAVEIARRTRTHPGIRAGAGPRGTQAMLLAARALAVTSGRDFVTPDDLKDMAPAVLGHRLMLRPEYEMEGMSSTEIIASILNDVPVPK